MNMEEFQFEEIQRFLETHAETSQWGISFQEVMEQLSKGNLMEVMGQLASGGKELLFAELSSGTWIIGQILIVALVGALVSGFSGMFQAGQVSETGFYVVYLLLMTFLATGFLNSVQIASEITDSLLEFMQSLLPAFFLALAAAGGTLTSASVCGFTLGAIGLMESVLSEFLIPLTKVYLLLVLAGNLYKEDMISRLTELLGNAIVWSMKAMFGLIVGFHVIQGMILPQADAVKNTAAVRLAQMVPGIGGGVGGVLQMAMGSGVLIKNTAGAAAVIILLMLAVIPVIKLSVLWVLYHGAAAVIQPVCDKRLVTCMEGVAKGHGILLQVVGYSAVLFIVTIAVLCISTNAVWYAG